VSTQDSAVTVHLYIRPGTPPGASEAVVTQIAELYEFGMLGAGSRVWVNIEIPGVMWLLSDRSRYVRIADVPTAGWVRLSGKTVSWGNTRHNITKTPGYVFSTSDMPMPPQPLDEVTVALRNTDKQSMCAMHSGNSQEMQDFEIVHRSVCVVDLKLGGFRRKAKLAQPSDFDIHYASVRGLDLMAATTGLKMHRVIRENLDAFTTTIDVDRFDRIQATHQRMGKVSEGITEPVMERIKALEEMGSFQGFDEEDAFEPAD